MLRRLLVVASLLAVLGGIGGTTAASAAQLSIWTDRSEYSIGDTLRYCVTLPGPGQVEIRDNLPTGQSNVIASWYDNGSGGCSTGTVTPPSGTECLQVIYRAAYDYGQALSTQTCFTVRGSAPYPSIAKARVWTNKSFYRLGETGKVCWDVSQPGFIVITDTGPGGYSTTPVSRAVGAGRDCVIVTFGPPIGSDTLLLTLYQGNTVVASDTSTYSMTAGKTRHRHDHDDDD
jgi:hypothetical protein